MRKYFTKKRIIIGGGILVVLALIGWGIARGRNNTSNILTDTVKKQDLKQTVLSTGEVTSSTDLNLSFKGSGNVAKVNVKVGQAVTAGTILANLDQKDQLAAATSARGSLAAAQANYQKVVSGNSSEAVQIAQVSLDNAKKSLADVTKQQQTLVDNAQTALLNSGLAAVPKDSNLGNAPLISGTYQGPAGYYEITFYNSNGGVSYVYKGLESGVGTVDLGAFDSLGKRGLHIQFTEVPHVTDVWLVEIPNPRSATYVTNQNAYNAALQNQQAAVSAAQNAVNAAQANLDLQRAQARPADLQAAKAQILSAEGQVQAAAANLENTVIRAPANGTITTVDIKVGELSTPAKTVIVLQDVDNLHVKANISEANIASVQVGQEVTFTFDALGPDKEYKGQVQTIDPASTVISGVVNYQVTASVQKLPEIKPGMTANMTILTATKNGVLTVPQRSVLQHDGKKFVRVIDNPKKKTYHEVEVSTGLEADGGLMEITSGLDEGQAIVSYINTK